MGIELSREQHDAIERLRTGSILVGGVGSGKSRTAIAYYFTKVCGGSVPTEDTDFSPMKSPKDLYIITTAKKRDDHEWEGECIPFLLSTKEELSIGGACVHVDSWNNILKYAGVKDAFFIFDEQRVVGNGVWVKSFLKIAKSNDWILLSATPGDTWMDYIPVFIANGWYKNRTEFVRRHVVFNHYSKFPKIDHYIETGRLIKLRESVIVDMHYCKKTISHDEDVVVNFNKKLFDDAFVRRWHVYKQQPIRDISELCYVLRQVVNSDPSRLDAVARLFLKHPKIIIFYNFDYERDLLLKLGSDLGIPTTQWNGHRHESIPETDKWMYIVQYAAGAEGWNCIETDAMIFFSQNYSYKATIQASGRIDRRNTPFTDLYYYHLRSNSYIDLAILKAFNNKRDFNENRFMSV
jgi:hypothetical protein